jgi:hypothetical protein
MTAVGFFIFAVAYMVIAVSQDVAIPEWLELTVSALAVSGLVMMLWGVTTWLWRVMP